MTNTKKTRIRLLSFLLALALCIGAVPSAVFAAEESEEDYQTAKLEYFSKVLNEYVTDSCYYTDKWFDADPAVRNDSLALWAAQLAAGSTDDSNHVVATLTALGFDAAGKRYDSTSADDSAYILGTKTLDGRKLAVVSFQGDLYGDKGWQQNVKVNSADNTTPDHASYSAAAKAFLGDFDALGFGEEDILLVMGQSRGGAIANLAAAYLLDRDSHPTVFGYTLEAPATTENADAHDTRYAGIHNYLSDDDPVTMLPLWGMTRYGEEFIYNTRFSFDEVMESLEKLNAPAAEYYLGNDQADPHYNRNYAEKYGMSVKEYLTSLTDNLGTTVPTRDAYTAPNERPEIGSFTYQEGLEALCHVIFGSPDAMDTLKTELTGLLGEMEKLIDVLSRLVFACSADAYAQTLPAGEDKDAAIAASAEQYYGITERVCALMTEKIGASVEKTGVYALLNLLAPLLVDVSPALEEDYILPNAEEYVAQNLAAYEEDYDIPEDIQSILSSVLNLALDSGTLVFSHHPDVILARLKLLAPAPVPDDIALTITEPAAGDDAAAAPGETEDAAKALGLPWLTVEDLAWRTDDDVLESGKAYYLDATLVMIGHSGPDDFRFTLNGEDFGNRTVEYRDGEMRVSGTWKFTIGTPEQVTVSFDTDGHAPAPDPVTMDKGTPLSLSGMRPDDLGTYEDDTACWRWQFVDWEDENGTPWDNLLAEEDMTLSAKWIRLIDKIELTYEIPHEDDRGEDLLLLRAPDGVPYELREFLLHDEVYSYHYYAEGITEETALDGDLEWTFDFKVFLCADDVAFYTDPDDEYTYAGLFTINGEDIEMLFHSPAYYASWEEKWYEAFVDAEYTFNLLPAEPEKPEEEEKPGTSVRPWIPFPSIGSELLALRRAALESESKPQTDAAPAAPAADNTPVTPDVPAAEQTPVFVDVPAGAYYADAVDWAVKLGITSGVDETHFAPDGSCTRAQMVTFLWRAVGCPAPADAANPFADVPGDAYFADAVLWAYQNGVTTGTDPEHFSPGESVTRGQAVTLLCRLMDEAADGENPFLDVPDGAYYRDAVVWALSRGVTRGVSDSLFAPDDVCTRGQIVTFLYRLLGNA
ncbi:MAG: S-layer homology domain-containing protein [Clostridiales bacterium]|nr:S-layer homology domain-containing protein [Clostridiales bacterium]